MYLVPRSKKSRGSDEGKDPDFLSKNGSAWSPGYPGDLEMLRALLAQRFPAFMIPWTKLWCHVAVHRKVSIVVIFTTLWWWILCIQFVFSCGNCCWCECTGLSLKSSKIVLDKRTSGATENTTVGRIRPAGLGLGTPGLAGPLKRDMGHVIDKGGKENTPNWQSKYSEWVPGKCNGTCHVFLGKCD